MTTDALIHAGRALERLALIAMAGYSIYFGFRLFYIAQRHTGIIELKKGDWQLKLSRVAPGICFAIFGAGMAIAMAFSPVESTFTMAFSPLESTSESRRDDSGVPGTTTRRSITASDESALRICRAIATVERGITINASTANSLKGALQELSRLKNKLAIERFGEKDLFFYKENSASFKADPSAFSQEQRNLLDSIDQWLGVEY